MQQKLAQHCKSTIKFVLKEDKCRRWDLSDVVKSRSQFLFFFFVFLPFVGPLPRHMEIPRLGV